MTVLWELHHDRKLMGMGHTARCFLVILPVIFSLLRCSRQEKKRLSFKFLSLGVDYGRISRCPRCTSQTNEPGERDLGDKIGKEKKKKKTLGKELELRGINLLVNQGEIKNCCIYS